MSVTHEGFQTGDSDLGASCRIPNFLWSPMRSRQEGPEEDILNRFSTAEIVIVIGIVVCMVAAVSLTLVQNE
jgi:hypothetical protein